MQNNDYIFLTYEQAIDIHKSVIEEFGGSLGIRDEGLLLSALGEPQQTFGGEYLNATIFHMAAAYAYSFAKNHAFIDGNKRVALKTSAIFLNLNNYDLMFTNEEYANLILDCVIDKITKQDMAKMFEDNAIKWS